MLRMRLPKSKKSRVIAAAIAALLLGVAWCGQRVWTCRARFDEKAYGEALSHLREIAGREAVDAGVAVIGRGKVCGAYKMRIVLSRWPYGAGTLNGLVMISKDGGKAWADLVTWPTEGEAQTDTVCGEADRYQMWTVALKAGEVDRMWRACHYLASVELSPRPQTKSETSALAQGGVKFERGVFAKPENYWPPVSGNAWYGPVTEQFAGFLVETYLQERVSDFSFVQVTEQSEIDERMKAMARPVVFDSVPFYGWEQWRLSNAALELCSGAVIEEFERLQGEEDSRAKQADAARSFSRDLQDIPLFGRLFESNRPFTGRVPRGLAQFALRERKAVLDGGVEAVERAAVEGAPAGVVCRHPETTRLGCDDFAWWARGYLARTEPERLKALVLRTYAGEESLEKRYYLYQWSRVPEKVRDEAYYKAFLESEPNPMMRAMIALAQSKRTGWSAECDAAAALIKVPEDEEERFALGALVGGLSSAAQGEGRQDAERILRKVLETYARLSGEERERMREAAESAARTLAGLGGKDNADFLVDICGGEGEGIEKVRSAMLLRLKEPGAARVAIAWMEALGAPKTANPRDYLGATVWGHMLSYVMQYGDEETLLELEAYRSRLPVNTNRNVLDEFKKAVMAIRVRTAEDAVSAAAEELADGVAGDALIYNTWMVAASTLSQRFTLEELQEMLARPDTYAAKPAILMAIEREVRGWLWW